MNGRRALGLVGGFAVLLVAAIFGLSPWEHAQAESLSVADRVKLMEALSKCWKNQTYESTGVVIRGGGELGGEVGGLFKKLVDLKATAKSDAEISGKATVLLGEVTDGDARERARLCAAIAFGVDPASLDANLGAKGRALPKPPIRVEPRPSVPHPPPVPPVERRTLTPDVLEGPEIVLKELVSLPTDRAGTLTVTFINEHDNEARIAIYGPPFQLGDLMFQTDPAQPTQTKSISGSIESRRGERVKLVIWSRGAADFWGSGAGAMLLTVPRTGSLETTIRRK